MANNSNTDGSKYSIKYIIRDTDTKRYLLRKNGGVLDTKDPARATFYVSRTRAAKAAQEMINRTISKSLEVLEIEITVNNY